MTVVLHINEMDAQAWQTRLAESLPNHEVALADEVKDPANVHYALAWKHDAGSLLQYPNLRVIFSLGAGVDHVFADPRLPKVPIVRVVNADLTARMSEWVVLHCLLHLRQQRMYDWQQSVRIWASDPNQPAASDVRIGMMGMGVLGRDAAQKLHIIGFNVAGWSRKPHKSAGIAAFAGQGELDAFLARTDILVCLLPSTPATNGILNARLFEKLARDGHLAGPVLLNAGRGALQVEADILASLNGGILRAATLDVFQSEPLPDSSALWQHPGITISPHNAAISDPNAISKTIARQILAFEAGEGLKDVVDPATHY